MARGDQLGRQWRIIQSLTAATQGKTVLELAEDLDCHQRSVYRDLEALQAGGFPLYTEKVDGKNRWMLLEAARRKTPIPFSLPELMALYFSRNMLKAHRTPLFHDALEALFDKIKAVLPEETLTYLDRMEKTFHVAPKPYPPRADQNPAHIAAVRDAIAEQRVMEMTYYTMSRKTETRRHVAPYRLWFFDGAFYLVGECRLRGELRIFAVDRIRSLRLTEERFTLPEDPRIDAYLDESFGVFLGDTQRVRIRFAPDVAGYIREKIWHKTQSIRELEDGSVEFEARVAGTDEIKFWIMKWGAGARVLEPAALCEEIRAEAEAMRRYYAP